MNKLNPKQKTFCDEYLVDLNATQAAIRAGYSKKTAKVIGAENLTKPAIATYIDKRMDKRAEKTGVTIDWVVNKLKDLVEICMASKPVTIKVNGELVESGKYKVDSFGAKGALELLGKHLGMFKENEKDPVPAVNLYQLLSGGNNGDLKDEAKLKEQFGFLYPANGRGSNRL